jgi:pyruvate formate lyase activating enzyme
MSESVNWDVEGLVFDIQRFSVHDGPGIRTVVFLKGCPLTCKWCSNPESQSIHPQLMYNENECIKCGRCIEACPTHGLEAYMSGEKSWSDHPQPPCGKCVDACPTKALTVSGKYMTVKEVFDAVAKDQKYYRRSGGGVTLSGGEPMLQTDFARELFKACKERGWSTAIETTAFASPSGMKEVFPYLDVAFLDIKSMDDEMHKKMTGVTNKVVQINAKLLARSGAEVIVRVPVIPTINDSEKNISETADFVKDCGIKSMQLLPYHRLGINKYGYIGREYPMDENIKPPSAQKMARLKEIIVEKGINSL